MPHAGVAQGVDATASVMLRQLRMLLLQLMQRLCKVLPLWLLLLPLLPGALIPSVLALALGQLLVMLPM